MEEVRAIKIIGDNAAVLSTNLKDILKCFDYPGDIFWAILWVNATTKPESTLSILDFEKKVNKSPNGIMLSWLELEYLAFSINQATEILIIGNFNAENSIRYKDDKEMYERCSYVIELVDSSYWEIHTRDSSFLERAKKLLVGAHYM